MYAYITNLAYERALERKRLGDFCFFNVIKFSKIHLWSTKKKGEYGCDSYDYASIHIFPYIFKHRVIFELFKAVTSEALRNLDRCLWPAQSDKLLLQQWWNSGW